MLNAKIFCTDGKPSDRDIRGLRRLLPVLDITWGEYHGGFQTQYVIYNALSFPWLKTILIGDYDVKCLVTTRERLEAVGIFNHIGLYNLDDDGTHDFYISLAKDIDKRALANGFHSNFEWDFCHEYLHGVVWKRYNDRKIANDLVHQWEKDGLLKQKIAEHVADYNSKLSLIALLTQKLKSLL